MIREQLSTRETVGLQLVRNDGLLLLEEGQAVPEGFVKAQGMVQFDLHDKDGNLTSSEKKNLVVAVGLAFITGRMIGTTPAVMSHMGVGSGTTAAASADSTLGNQLGARAAITSATRVTTTVANDSVQYVATFGSGIGTGAVTEAGLFNASTAGEMLARTVFPVINKGADDSLTVTWKITLS